MSKPVDTSKLPPEAHLASALAQGSSESIEASERAGQSQIVNSDVIPTDGSTLPKDVEALEALGFELGEVNKEDPLFRACKLPPGWERQGSSHSMWSYIADERGMRRIAVFYKAAFYDRGAHMHIEREPRTLAQDEAAETFYREFSKKADDKVDSHMDGDILVLRHRKIKKDEHDKPVYDRETHEWEFTGEEMTARFDMAGDRLEGDSDASNDDDQG